MRKLFRRIHLWLSIPLGIIITVICLSGAILVFQDEIEEWSDSDKYFVEEASENPLPIGKLIKIVNSKSDNNTVTSVRIPSDPKRNYIMGLKDGNRASVYVNPYTGDITGKTERGDGFFSIIQRLHRWLLGSKGSVGQSIVGYTTLFFVIILLTGIILWWPKSKKQLKNRVQIKTKYGIRRFWIDLHTSGGIYLVTGLLVLSLTGLYYSFDWYRKGLYGILGVEMTDFHTQQRQPGGNPNHNSSKEKRDSLSLEEPQKRRGGNPNYRSGNNPNYKDKNTSTHEKTDDILQKNNPRKNENSNEEQVKPSVHNRGTSSWQIVFDKLKEKNPDFKAITLQNNSATVTQNFTFGNARASDRYTFDNETGEITKSQLYKDQDGATKVRGWIYTLHTGKWGGLFSKILTCLIALVGGCLPFTGYYIYIVKRKGKLKKK